MHEQWPHTDSVTVSYSITKHTKGGGILTRSVTNFVGTCLTH